jgi:hypothetical protein
MTREKTSGGMAQVIEFLPNKCEALSSIPNTAKRENNGDEFVQKGERSCRGRFGL